MNFGDNSENPDKRSPTDVPTELMSDGDGNRLGRWTGTLVTTAALLVMAVEPVSAQTGMNAPWEPTPGHLARTGAHLVGILGGLAIIYYADRVRRRTRGSTLGRSMLMVEVATVLFVTVFLGMEGAHFFGVQLWYFADTMAVTQLWYMLTLAVVMLLYTLSYRTLVVEMGG